MALGERAWESELVVEYYQYADGPAVAVEPD